MSFLIALLMLFPTNTTNNSETAYLALVVSMETDAEYSALMEEWEDTPDYALNVVIRALREVGNNYRYASDDPEKGFDCSGFVRYAYAPVDDLPNTSRSQIKHALDVEDPRPGDILYYPGHVMIYVGDGAMVHAANRRTGVVVSDIPSRNIEVGRIVPSYVDSPTGPF